MGVYKLSANSVKNGRTIYGSMLAGNTAFLPTSYESIATVTVGSGGASTVTISNIPQTYTHLQIRASFSLSQSDWANIYVNSDTTNANYKQHELRGNGTTASGTTPAASRYGCLFALANADAIVGSVTDLLDYTSTNKNKTFRTLTGNDNNSSGYMQLTSGLWLNSSTAVTSISFILESVSNTFKQHSRFALYGIKSA